MPLTSKSVNKLQVIQRVIGKARKAISVRNKEPNGPTRTQLADV